jgi:arylsulfatase A-like enzyme
MCAPSRAGFFTGQYNQRFGFINNGGAIPDEMPMFPGAMQAGGYRTSLLGKWHSKGPMPHERGCFDETLCSASAGPFIDFHKPRLARNGKVEIFDQYSTDLFADEAEQFISENKDKPFFLTVSFNAPHILKVVKNAHQIAAEYDAAVAEGKTFDIPKVPMARPGEAKAYEKQFPGDTARADTVACIAALDEAVGRILDKLEQTGLAKNTMVFFFADNGGHPENRSENLPLSHYKWSLYEGGIRVPFFAVYPGVFPAGLTFEHPVSTLDIYPTVAAHADIEPSVKLDGVDLTPYLKSEKTAAPHDALYFKVDKQSAIRQGSWKLVMNHDGTKHLFDLSKDIEEQNDLAATHPDVVDNMVEEWNAWNAQLPAEQSMDKPQENQKKKYKS